MHIAKHIALFWSSDRKNKKKGKFACKSFRVQWLHDQCTELINPLAKNYHGTIGFSLA